MEDVTRYCLWGFGFFLVFLSFLVWFFRSMSPISPPKWHEVMRDYRRARTRGERRVVVLLATVWAFRRGYVGSLATIACGGFACLGAMCGFFDLPALLRSLEVVASWFSG